MENYRKTWRLTRTRTPKSRYLKVTDPITALRVGSLVLRRYL